MFFFWFIVLFTIAINKYVCNKIAPQTLYNREHFKVLGEHLVRYIVSQTVTYYGNCNSLLPIAYHGNMRLGGRYTLTSYLADFVNTLIRL